VVRGRKLFKGPGFQIYCGIYAPGLTSVSRSVSMTGLGYVSAPRSPTPSIDPDPRIWDAAGPEQVATMDMYLYEDRRLIRTFNYYGRMRS